ncbi:MAG: hypothetical protein EKK46_05495 [Rhodocyclaceae bacterium]|nr:MAG: hypothetical protein EKK46_05495 [Rhodocyclaceae bacterium]
MTGKKRSPPPGEWMEAQEFLHWLVPSCVFVMMVCIGLDVTPVRFINLTRAPQPLLLGVLGQLLIGPACGFFVAFLFQAHPEISLGIILLVAAPGGPVANAIVYVFKGFPEVSVALTAINGIISLAATPLIANLGFRLLANENVDIHLPIGNTMKHIFIMVVSPIFIGMALRRLVQKVDSVSRWARRISLVMLTAIFGILLFTTWDRIVALWWSMLPAAALLCLLILLSTFFAVRIARLGETMAFTIATEVSIHNVPVALLMAEIILGQPQLSGFVLVYVPVIALMIATWGLLRNRSRRTERRLCLCWPTGRQNRR